MIHIISGLVNEAEVDALWKSLVFSMIQRKLAILSLVPLPFLNPVSIPEVLGSCTVEAYLEGF